MIPYPLPDGTTLEIGDRIYWRNVHHLRTGHDRGLVKCGLFLGLVKHTISFKGSKQMAIVRFDGNKGHSRVPFDELRKAKL